LLLDEPLSDLDPIARQDVLTALLDQFRNDDVTIVVSSHMLAELERIADRIVYLEAGRITVDADLDELRERYAEWIVTSPEGRLPQQYAEEYVISTEGDRHRARLFVRTSPGLETRFAGAYGARIEARPLNLERIFRLLSGPMSRNERDEQATVETVGGRQ